VEAEIVWLNEAQFFLDPAEAGLGERVAAGLRELLRHPGQAVPHLGRQTVHGFGSDQGEAVSGRLAAASTNRIVVLSR
jgi:hypothetical protein